MFKIKVAMCETYVKTENVRYTPFVDISWRATSAWADHFGVMYSQKIEPCHTLSPLHYTRALSKLPNTCVGSKGLEIKKDLEMYRRIVIYMLQ